MSVCNPGYCCTPCCANLTTKVPTTLLSGCCQIQKTSAPIFCTAMSDTIGVLWRAASGTVDPWTKNIIVCCSKQSLVKASGGMMTAAQAQNCAYNTATNVLTKGGADPSQFGCGVKKSLCLATGSVEKIVIFAAIAIFAFLIISNMVTRR